MASSPARTHAQPGPTPKYIQDFSKALAGEVKILLAEVGKLRDEKRALQFEISELMSIKARHNASLADAGYAHYPGHGWRPFLEGPPPPEVPPPPAAPAPGGWRMVQAPHVPRRKQPKQLQERQQQQQQLQTQQQLSLRGFSAPAPAKAVAKPAAKQEEPSLPAWAQWRSNPLLAPGALAGPSMAVVSPPPREGLFGPNTPPPKAR
ncbi:hypothetical protein B0H13DRAFT_2272779 [Mycena leptocephala]|nr:hypothetical protein B0H13DRAFT_2272779 [Mycena leptocephala]